MASQSVTTLKDFILQKSRSLRLQTLERRIVKKLFSEVPVHRLRSFLVLFSIRASSGLAAKKAVDMCVARYYRGEEKNRLEAVKLFQSVRGCMDYMEKPLVEVQQALRPVHPSSAPSGDAITIDDDEALVSDGSFNNSGDTSGLLVDHEQNYSHSNGIVSDSVASSDTPTGELMTQDGQITILAVKLDRLPDDTVENSAPNNANDEFVDRFTKEVQSSGMMTLILEAADLLETMKTNSCCTGSPVLASHYAPSVLGLREPAFYRISACLANFSFECSATGILIPNIVEFDVPIIQENECVILMFRSIGKIRDVRQTDHPFGLIYALNQESKSPSFKKTPPSFSAKLWEKSSSTFDHPIVLSSVVAECKNELHFKFTDRPRDPKYQCRYQGYIFLATERIVPKVMSGVPRLSVRDGLKIVLNLLTGADGELPASEVTIPTMCSITLQPLDNPCRGSTCDHSGCFDGTSYLQMEKACLHPRWKCQICQRIVHWYDLRRDGLMEFLLKSLPRCGKIHARLLNTTLLFNGLPKLSEPENDETVYDEHLAESPIDRGILLAESSWNLTDHSSSKHNLIRDD